MKQLPNLISFFRTLLAVVMAILLSSIVLEQFNDNNILHFAFWITIAIIGLDWVDGIIARKFNLTSDFGAFFDIACDRIVELIYIALFAVLEWIPFWILIVFLVRGILVDGIRGFAIKEGETAFGKKSMMKNKLGHFLTSSRFMRAFYGIVKAIAFAFMFLVMAGNQQYLDLEMFLIYLVTFLCIIRGIPVLIEGKRFFYK